MNANIDDWVVPTLAELESERENQGLSQSELARRAGVDKSYPQKMQCKKGPQISLTLALADVLFDDIDGVYVPSVDDLYSHCRRRGHSMRKVSIEAGLGEGTFSKIINNNRDPYSSTVRSLVSTLTELPSSDEKSYGDSTKFTQGLHSKMVQSDPEDLNGLTPMGERRS